MTKKLLITIFFGFLGFTTYGQKASVRATIEPSEIQIGNQAVINLEVIAPKDANILFPVFKDTIIKGIEVLGMLRPDTITTEVMKISQKYIITSFDSTLYHIDRIPVFADNDTIYSNELGLKVTTPELSDSTATYLEGIKNRQISQIDYNKLGLNDLKGIQYTNWTLFDTAYDFVITSLPYVLGLIGLAIVIGLVIFFIYRKRKKGYYFKPEIKLPPHVIALSKLDKLKDSKIWQQGQVKEFYTSLTDILREYIEGRYNINAPEMTSDEILEAIRGISEVKSTVENLSQILGTSDLVKFAKFTPLTDENDLSLINTYLFINQTKIEEEVQAENTTISPSVDKIQANNKVTDQIPDEEETNSNKENNEERK